MGQKKNKIHNSLKDWNISCDIIRKVTQGKVSRMVLGSEKQDVAPFKVSVLLTEQ